MKGRIRFCYRKIIDSQTIDPWSKAVFEATHLEFFMQVQRLDPAGKYQYFSELSRSGFNTEELQYLTSTAAKGYLLQLEGLIPDVASALGKRCLPFTNFRFEILESHISDKSAHRVAIWFYSDEVYWIDSIGNQVLIQYTKSTEESGHETDLIPMVPFLSISEFLFL